MNQLPIEIQQEIWKDIIYVKYGFRPINIDVYNFIWISKGKHKEDNLWTPKKSL